LGDVFFRALADSSLHSVCFITGGFSKFMLLERVLFLILSMLLMLMLMLLLLRCVFCSCFLWALILYRDSGSFVFPSFSY
jgi:hypothetical protein